MSAKTDKEGGVRLPDFSGESGLFFIAGPCMMESRELVLETAERVVAECVKRGAGVVFKSSFDKANRTSGQSARGWEWSGDWRFWRKFAGALAFRC